MGKLIMLVCLLLVMLVMPVQLSMAQEAAPGTVKSGDAVRGAALFTGSISFAKGAAACGACHALANRGINGGKMAADLGGLFTPDGADAIKDAIGAIETPVMKKMYAANPLSDQEYADMAAFARQPLPDQKPDRGSSFPLAGIGAAGLFMLGFVLYKRRIS